jgi:hypothetical protein
VLELVARLPLQLRDGDGRNNAAFRVAAFLAHDTRLAPADAADVLRAWNATHAEPLGEAALARVAANAVRYGGRRLGRGRAA